jgi:sugar phosphate isomerase/epimerase
MTSPNPDLLALNAATLREQWDLRRIVEACARHRVRGVAPWRDQLATIGVKDMARMCRDQGVTVTALCGAGGFPAADRKGRKSAIEQGLRAIEEAATLEARCLALVAGGLPRGSRDLAGTREMVRDAIGEILDHARSCGVRLAIEPLHPMYAAERSCVSTLAHALDLCDELESGRSGSLGVMVDVYHVWWDPTLAQQIERAGDKRLLGYQISDWLVPTTDLAADRGMMGDGVIDLPLIRSWMEAAGYRGFHEVEILSKANWWRKDADEVLLTCKLRHESAS